MRQQDAYPTNAGLQLKLCATPSSRAIFLSLIVCLYLDKFKAIKINGSVKCMHVACYRTAIDNWWSSRGSSPDINNAPAIHKITHASHGHESVVSRLSQMMLQKCSKHILLIMDSPLGATAT